MQEFLIAAAKILGLAISTVVGICGLLGRAHEGIERPRLIQVPGGEETETARRLTRLGWISLGGIIIGCCMERPAS